MSEQQKIKVFVTYSQEGDAHNTHVLSLTYHLRKLGFEANTDLLLSQEQGSINLNRMMYQHLEQADKVVVVLSENYARKANNFTGGVGAEYEFIIGDINTKPQKYILVALEAYKDSLFPTGLRSRLMLDLTTEEGMETLVRKLSGQPAWETSTVAATTPVLPTKKIPPFEFKQKPPVDVTVTENKGEEKEDVWDLDAAETALTAAIADGRPEVLAPVLQENSFLFFDIYERKMGAMPIFHEISFGSFKADFAWLDDASDGPRWFLLKLGPPDLELFDAAGHINPALVAAIEEVKVWANYFDVHPAEKKRIFGAVASFRFRLVIGSKEQWQEEKAQQWRRQHNKTSPVEIRSYQTFTRSLAEIRTASKEFYRFSQYHATSPAAKLEEFWKAYRYMDDWRKWL